MGTSCAWSGSARRRSCAAVRTCGAPATSRSSRSRARSRSRRGSGASSRTPARRRSSSRSARGTSSGVRRRCSAPAQSGDLAAQAKEVAGAKVLAARVQGDGKSLRELADKLRDKLGKGVIALGAEADGKAILLVAVTKDLTARVKAGDLVKDAAKLVGGSGGGKPDLAQAGGSDPAGIEKALARIEELATQSLA